MTANNTPSCLVLFSGGTDSLCAATLACEKFENVLLVTFFDQSTKASPFPDANVEKLRKKFPKVRVEYLKVNTDSLVRKLTYQRYFYHIKKFGFLVLSNPAYSSLSWHFSALLICKKRGMSLVWDGMTKELMHLPGHMQNFLDQMKKLYKDYGIQYENPVRGWDIPPERELLGQLVVNSHDHLFPSEESEKLKKKTTGQYLFDRGLFSAPNIKGSKLDQSMQHDCYPFVLYNIVVFWIYGRSHTLETFTEKMRHFIEAKVIFLSQLAEEKFNHSIQPHFITKIEEQF